VRRDSGQSLVEATFALLIFFALLIGVIDCGQVLVAHQSLVERVRSAVRWGAVHPWNGSAQIENLILYNQTHEPRSTTAGFLGMNRDNVQIRYQQASAERPDDATLSVAIVNYQHHFFSPWLSRPFVNPRPVFISAPMRP
jgi:hypothetical protein